MGSRRARRVIHVEVVEPGSKREIVRAFKSKGLDASTAEMIVKRMFESLHDTLLELARRSDDLEELIYEAGLPDAKRLGFYTGLVCVESQSLLACTSIRSRYSWFPSALREVWRLQHRLAQLGVHIYTRLAARMVVADTPHPQVLLLALEEVESYAQRPDVEERIKRATLPPALALLTNALVRAFQSIAPPVAAPYGSALRSWLLSLMRRYSHFLSELVDPDLVDYEHLDEIYALTRSNAVLGAKTPLFTLIATPRAYEAYLYTVIFRILERRGWRLTNAEIDRVTNCSGLILDHSTGPLRLYMGCVPHRLSRIVCSLTRGRRTCKTPRPDVTLETQERVVSFEAKYRELNGKKLERNDAMRIAAYLFDVSRNEKLTLVLTHVNERAETATIHGRIDGKPFEVHIVPLTPNTIDKFEALLANLL